MDWFLTALDYVPVLGSIKNGAEAGYALYEGNTEEAVTKCTQAVVGGILDVYTFGVGGSVGKALVKEMTKESTKVIVKTVAKKTAGYGAINVGFRAANIQIAKKNNHVYISDDDPPPPPPPNMRERLNPRRTTERITLINNRVLNAIKEIIDRFVEKKMNTTINNLVTEGRLANDSIIMRAYNQPLPQNIIENIETMAVYVDVDPNINGVAHDQFYNIILDEMYLHMADIYDGMEDFFNFLDLEPVENVRDYAESALFIRNDAVDIWRNTGQNMDTYNATREAVVRMFMDLEQNSIEWMRELKDIQLPLQGPN